ncbi:MAG: hypothetical protein PHI53_02085 [Candidatus Pacebacteria bacterium]|nr:hypothetical protein [Candidatus Paceibacterota bacterium]
MSTTNKKPDRKTRLNDKEEKGKIVFEKIEERFEQKRSMIVFGCDAFGCAC